MDLSGVSNSSVFFNPTTGASFAGFTGLSDAQLFFNPSVHRKPLKTDSIDLSGVNRWDLNSAATTYTSTGLLFSSNPASSLQPSFGLLDQYDLLARQQSYSALSADLIEKYLSSSAAESESTLDTAA